MTISSLQGGSSAWQTAAAALGAQRPHLPSPPPGMQGAAKALGMSDDELRTSLQGGAKLTDLASAKGVSTADLTTAIKDDLKTHKPSGAPELSDEQLTQMASGFVSGQRPHGPGRGHGAGQREATQALGALASATGTDASALLEQLTAGDTSAVSALLASPYSSASRSTAGGLLVDLQA